jgi:hypothetical protein
MGMSDKTTHISQFSNDSGGLRLWSVDEVYYLGMTGRVRNKVFGPLTANEISAYRLLCGLDEAAPSEEGCQ